MSRRYNFFWAIAMILCAAPGLATGECPIFPANNIWNVRVDRLPVDAHSNAYIESIGSRVGLHPDFGAGVWDGGPIGIPYTTVPGTQPRMPVTFDYADESDPGPYPIPPNPPIEHGGDHHILIVDQDHCLLYELWDSEKLTNGQWRAGSGAIFDLRSNALRPDGWTSADAAGLPILPGLARCEDLAKGAINHALRFTAVRTQRRYLWPARHYASSSTDPNLPPMGQRFRLKANFDLSGYSAQTRVILTALKTYGMMLADNGSNWYISGAPGACWNDETLVAELSTVTGDHFEAVDVSGLMVNADSAAGNGSGPAWGIQTPGLYAPATGAFYLRNDNSAGVANLTYRYGPASAGWLPLTGDWDGNGTATVGLYVPAAGAFFLKNSHGGGAADIAFFYGPANAGWLPLAGDWDGDGVQTVGLYDPATGAFFLKNSHGGGAADIAFFYGPANVGWLPLAGDWDGDGVQTVGLHDPATGAFFLKNSHGGGAADIAFFYGPANAGWLPLAGDWDGDGVQTVGLYDPATGGFFLRNRHAGGNADLSYRFGPAGAKWAPLTGNWDGANP